MNKGELLPLLEDKIKLKSYICQALKLECERYTILEVGDIIKEDITLKPTEFVITIEDDIEIHHNKVLASDTKYIRLEKNIQVKSNVQSEKNLLWPMIVTFDQKINENLCKNIVNFMESNITKAIKKDNMYLLRIDSSNSLDSHIFKEVTKICFQLHNRYHINIEKDSGYVIKKIFSCQQLNNYENNNDKKMKIMIGLNDNYDGGDIYYPSLNFSSNLKCGEIIVFPPYWTHAYVIYPPLNQTYFYLLETFVY